MLNGIAEKSQIAITDDSRSATRLKRAKPRSSIFDSISLPMWENVSNELFHFNGISSWTDSYLASAQLLLELLRIRGSLSLLMASLHRAKFILRWGMEETLSKSPLVLLNQTKNTLESHEVW